MSDPLDQIRFLASSENRVQVLTHLRDVPADREDLSDQLGISRSTLSRVLTGLEGRHWIEQHGSECEITPLGACFADEFTSLVEAVETMQKFEGVVDYLPIDEVDFELTRLRDATVTTPTQTDPGAPLRRAKELLDEADEFRFLTNTVVSSLAEYLREQTVEGELTLEGVITRDLLDAVRGSPEFVEPTEEMIESGRAAFYCYDGTVSRTLGIADETIASITRIDPDGYQRAQVETEDRHVCSWVMATIEECRRESERITVSALTE